EDGIRDRNVTGVQTCALPILLAARAITRLDEHAQTTLRDVLQQALQDHDDVVFTQRQLFNHDLKTRLDQAGLVLTPAVLRTLLAELGEHDDQGELVTKRNGDPEPNPDLRDTENVPWDQDIHQYLEAEVKPFSPDAC